MSGGRSMIDENEQRAFRAEDCLGLYRSRRGFTDCTGSEICDLIADLLHLAQRESLDVDAIHRIARQHWAEESAEAQADDQRWSAE